MIFTTYFHIRNRAFHVTSYYAKNSARPQLYPQKCCGAYHVPSSLIAPPCFWNRVFFQLISLGNKQVIVHAAEKTPESANYYGLSFVATNAVTIQMSLQAECTSRKRCVCVCVCGVLGQQLALAFSRTFSISYHRRLHTSLFAWVIDIGDAALTHIILHTVDI